jgi:glutathione S-transferase
LLEAIRPSARAVGAGSTSWSKERATSQRWAAESLAAAVSGATTGEIAGAVIGVVLCCLVPQLFNARRFDCDLSSYPTVLAVEKNCLALPEFRNAAPELQPDAS